MATIEQAVETYQGIGVQCGHISTSETASLCLAGVVDVDGPYAWQMVIKGRSAALIAVTIGSKTKRFSVTTAFQRLAEVFDDVSARGYPNVYITFPAGEYYITFVQLEHGNKVTDWREAPEDTDAKIASAGETITEEYTSVVADSQKILLEAMRKYVLTSDFDAFTESISTQFSVSAESVDILFSRMQEAVTALEEGTENEFAEWKKYIRFIDGAIILGQEGNPLILTLVNDRISFTSSGQEVAYFSNNRLYVSDMEVATAIIADLVFSRSQDNHILINVRR